MTFLSRISSQHTGQKNYTSHAQQCSINKASTKFCLSLCLFVLGGMASFVTYHKDVETLASYWVFQVDRNNVEKDLSGYLIFPPDLNT